MMNIMVSNARPSRTRKAPGERRAEIIAAASGIAIAGGLESVSLRAVATAIGVQPGLVSHYFPAVEELVAISFTEGMRRLRSPDLPESASPTHKMLAFIDEQAGPNSLLLMSLWLNARHLSRRSAAIGMVIEEVEESDRRKLIDLISEGSAVGEFPEVDPIAAAIRILMALDGYGAYVNSPLPFDHSAYTGFVVDVAEWALGMLPGALRSAYERMVAN